MRVFLRSCPRRQIGVTLHLHARFALQQHDAAGGRGSHVLCHQLATEYAGLYHSRPDLPHYTGALCDIICEVTSIWDGRKPGATRLQYERSPIQILNPVLRPQRGSPAHNP